MIGVAVSTHRRPDTLAASLSQWAHKMPDALVVVHDIHGEGIARTKNRSLSILMDSGCDSLFLADDDIHPLVDNWWEPFVEDPLPHLMHCWGRNRLINDDEHYATWTHPRGVLLYVERHVVERVGGMRTEFGRWGGEHVEWSRRIHDTGFTPHPFISLSSQGRQQWHCEDYRRTTPSTVGPEERAASADLRRSLMVKYQGSTDFVPFRN